MSNAKERTMSDILEGLRSSIDKAGSSDDAREAFEAVTRLAMQAAISATAEATTALRERFGSELAAAAVAYTAGAIAGAVGVGTAGPSGLASLRNVFEKGVADATKDLADRKESP